MTNDSHPDERTLGESAGGGENRMAPEETQFHLGSRSADLLGSSPVECQLKDLPHHEIVRELGRGGMGVVYLARNALMDRLEVLKVLNAHVLDRPGTSERFLREIRAAARLNHPNVVTAYSAMQSGPLFVFAMEHVAGYDLGQLVEGRGPLPINLACSFIHQAALGLQHAHERGMVHRDIKPGNLMLTRQAGRGIIKILDFGLAKASLERSDDGTATQEGQMMGTPHYVAPEQTVDAKMADIRADIYGLGCTLYHLLTGQTPFDGGVYDLIIGHRTMVARPVASLRPEVPMGLSDLIARMMAKAPGDRYQTPDEVAKVLLPFFKMAQAADSPVSPSPPELNQWATLIQFEAPERASPSLARPPRRWLGWAAALGVLVMVGAWGWWFTPRPGSPTHRPPTPIARTKPPTPVAPEAPKAEWIALFNGKNLDGWTSYPGQDHHWKVKNGILSGTGDSPSSYLVTQRKDFADIHLRVEVRLNWEASGAVCVRASDDLLFPPSDPTEPDCYEVQINRRRTTGTLTRQGETLAYQLLANDPGWNFVVLEIIARGNQAVVKVNGVPSKVYQETGSGPTGRRIALKIRHQPKTGIEFRKIEVLRNPPPI